MINIPDYSKPFDESFLDFVKNHKDVVLTQEKFQELLKKIDELEKNLAGTEKAVQESIEINEELKAENKHLKEVLISCKDYLPEWITPMDILAEIDKLEEK